MANLNKLIEELQAKSSQNCNNHFPLYTFVMFLLLLVVIVFGVSLHFSGVWSVKIKDVDALSAKMENFTKLEEKVAQLEDCIFNHRGCYSKPKGDE